MADPPPPPRTGLYADLLAGPAASNAKGSVISAAPVTYSYKVEETVATQDAAPKQRDASLQFKPTFRPQPKAKASLRRNISNTAFKQTSQDESAATMPPANVQAGKDIDFWKQQGNDAPMPQPKREWQKKSRREKKLDAIAKYYDEVYDPSRPNEYAAYKGSSEQYDERRQWKELLYSKAGNGRRSSKSSTTPAVASNPMFAPPPMDTAMSDAPRRSSSPRQYNDTTGEDAYARRAAMATGGRASPAAASAAVSTPVNVEDTRRKIAEAKARVAKIAADRAEAAKRQADNDVRENNAMSDSAPGLGTSISREPTMYRQPTESPAGLGASISREPVVYKPADVEMPDADQQTQEPAFTVPTKPGKAGLGKRLLEKQGWKAGQGLGANEDGITTHIEARAGKRKKFSDAEGGGYAPLVGKIVGGHKRKTGEEEPERAMSRVVKLPGMLRGLDVKQEIEEKDLQQRLGDFFGQKCGLVERVFIWTQDRGGNDEVFIQFAQDLSALVAVSPNSPLVFAGNDVIAQYYDASQFEAGHFGDT